MSDKLNPIELYAKVISEQARKGGHESESERDAKDSMKAAKENMRGGDQHVGKHHFAAAIDDVHVHAAKHDGHHVHAVLDDEHFSESTNKIKPGAVHRLVKWMNPHVSSEIHKKFTDDIVKWHSEDRKKNPDDYR